MTVRLLTLLAFVACAPESSIDTSAPADTDTGGGDTAETADTGSDTGSDTGPCSSASFSGPAPVVWYSLEDAGGASVIDDAGDYDAASSGAVTAVAGKAGNAAQLDGTTAHLDAVVPLSTGTFSWAGWVRLDTLPSSSIGVIANHGNGSTAYTGWLLVVDSTGVPSIYTEGGSSATEMATSTYTPLLVGDWNHVAFTFNAGEVFVYMNGNPAGGRSLNYSAVVDGGNPYVIGRDAHNGGRFLPGTVDEAGYWNVSLAAEDIRALFDDGECGLPSI